ncbi:hypothetical protein O4N73_25070 [Vibrio parahaemolyticus]|uniref:hypothetical protein n=1 Tax=Vibrio parahaemolyticus TaxID=670 RepID=UPI00215D0CAA|nr:hypothetical protein [Vibrio parahaemolyticus]EJB8443137.1 hypothetical protein [Vibrio parahaemolyticus]MCZ6372427.1 hypothetical protein [Vibrio parahaemolyticus]
MMKYDYIEGMAEVNERYAELEKLAQQNPKLLQLFKRVVGSPECVSRMLRFEVHFDEDTADTFVATISVQPTEFFRDVSAAFRTGDIDNLAL